jgi:HlyD family secretion protein
MIAEVYVDYNDEVEKDQLLAILDTSVLEENIREARAGLKSAKAQLEEAQTEYNRHLPLYEKGYISESEFVPVKTSLVTKKAALESAKATLDRAERNLNYAYIRSPINGIVIAKNVEEGQTMAASFNAPTLFQIAEDLSQMEIIVEVDESDIGLIKEGQKVRFEVQAYSDRIFEGTVEKIRLQPVTISNVVNYIAVVKATNEENMLLPGMTAEVDFIIEQKKDVLSVPNSALKFQPPEELIAEFHKRKQKELEAKGVSAENEKGGRMGEMPPPLPGSAAGDMAQLWYLDDKGNLEMEPVKIGMSDGTRTEIVMSRNLREGMKVIKSMAEASSSSSSNKNTRGPFGLPGPPRGGGGPPRGF